MPEESDGERNDNRKDDADNVRCYISCDGDEVDHGKRRERGVSMGTIILRLLPQGAAHGEARDFVGILNCRVFAKNV